MLRMEQRPAHPEADRSVRLTLLASSQRGTTTSRLLQHHLDLRDHLSLMIQRRASGASAPTCRGF